MIKLLSPWASLCAALMIASAAAHQGHHHSRSNNNNKATVQNTKRRSLETLGHNLNTHVGEEEDDHDHSHHHARSAMCGVVDPPHEDEVVEEARIEGFRESSSSRRQRRTQMGFDGEALCHQCITIDMYLHLITADLGDGPFIPHPQEAVDRLNNGDDTLTLGDFSDLNTIIGLFRDNVDVVNRAFAGTPFQFNFVADQVTETVNTDWTVYASEYAFDMSLELGQGDPLKMDVFLNYRLQRLNGDGASSGTNTLGFAFLPLAQLEYGDGVYLRYDVLTGGGYPNWNYGYAFVHEVGHWLGLHHTFESSLEDDQICMEGDTNDFVSDTAIQSGPTAAEIADCTYYLDENVEPLDTCPGLEGKDAIWNYLNYLDQDYCWEMKGEFTPLQIERMYRHFELYREHKTACEDPDDMEIEVIITFDKDHAEQNRITLMAPQGKLIFDSATDHKASIAYVYQESLYMDVCVPRKSPYLLTVYDSGKNGFTNGKVVVYRNRVLLHTLEGNSFGAKKTLPIGPAPNGNGPTGDISKDLNYVITKPISAPEELGGNMRGSHDHLTPDNLGPAPEELGGNMRGSHDHLTPDNLGPAPEELGGSMPHGHLNGEHLGT